MRKIVILTFSFFVLVPLIAQDKIITKEGETILAYGTEVGSTSVFYREKADEGAQTLKIAKEQVLMIKYQNGEKLMMDGDTDTAAPTSANSIPQAASEDMSISEEEEAALEARYMPEVTYTGKVKDKNTQSAFCQLAFTQGSRIADKNIEIIYKPGNYWEKFVGGVGISCRGVLKTMGSCGTPLL